MKEGYVNITVRMEESLMDRINSARFKLADGFEIKRAEFVRKAIEKLLEELEK